MHTIDTGRFSYLGRTNRAAACGHCRLLHLRLHLWLCLWLGMSSTSQFCCYAIAAFRQLPLLGRQSGLLRLQRRDGCSELNVFTFIAERVSLCPVRFVSGALHHRGCCLSGRGRRDLDAGAAAPVNCMGEKRTTTRRCCSRLLPVPLHSLDVATDEREVPP